jgi:hypothetical protein
MPMGSLPVRAHKASSLATLLDMSQPPDHEARFAALDVETRAARQDALAARHLAAAHDRDIADLAVKVDAIRSALNAHSVQTRERFDALERKMDNGFAEMRGKFDATAAGMEQIVRLLTGREQPGE